MNPQSQDHQAVIRRRFDEPRTNLTTVPQRPTGKSINPQVGAYTVQERASGERPIWSQNRNNNNSNNSLRTRTTPTSNNINIPEAELQPDIVSAELVQEMIQVEATRVPSAAQLPTQQNALPRNTRRVNFLQRFGANLGAGASNNGPRRKLMNRLRPGRRGGNSRNNSNNTGSSRSVASNEEGFRPPARHRQAQRSSSTRSLQNSSEARTADFQGHASMSSVSSSAPSRRCLIEDDDDDVESQTYDRFMAGMNFNPPAPAPPIITQNNFNDNNNRSPLGRRSPTTTCTRDRQQQQQMGPQVDSVLEIFPEANVTRIRELLRQESLTTALVVLAEESNYNAPSDEVIGPSQLQYATTYAQATTQDRRVIMSYLKEMFPHIQERDIESVLMKHSTHKGVAILSEHISRRNNNNINNTTASTANATSNERQLTLLMDDEPVVKHRGKLQPQAAQQSIDNLGPPTLKPQRSNSFSGGTNFPSSFSPKFQTKKSSSFGYLGEENENSTASKEEQQNSLKPAGVARRNSYDNVTSLDEQTTFDKILQRLHGEGGSNSSSASTRTTTTTRERGGTDNSKKKGFYDFSALHDH